MFDDKKELQENKSSDFIKPASTYAGDTFADAKRKKIILSIVITLGALILAALLWGLSSFIDFNKKEESQSDPIEELASNTPDGLGVYLDPSDDLLDENGNGINQDGLEYLAFGDFYEFNESSETDFNFKNYSLPINVKIDVANYYELSRKINLDTQLEELNSKGFVIFNNPWTKEGDDFYSVASALDNRQIPLFISADFISYYYQNILKASFKEIEETVFYESLWEISKDLYDSARMRYEAHLSDLGNINDPVLEAERLATAYFAVSLELLKPHEDQIEKNNRFASGIFSEKDQTKFNFQVPSYLNDDVLRELALIYKARDKQKSPVLLYDREYSDFVVPLEYRDNARLHNFYLAAAWLNSTFPLNYRSESCTDCLLDKDDWRVNFIAASFIAQDFSASQELKNEWARVYKTLSFFKGLRDSWNYIDYRESFEDLFGQEGDLHQIFAENNLQSDKNLEDLRSKLLARQLLPSQGAYNINLADGRRYAGLQFLADFYWPNDFILSSLRYPAISSYQGPRMLADNNITGCNIRGKNERCQGTAQDVLKLIYPSWQNEFFSENTNYSGYSEAVDNLRPVVNVVLKANLNNYWSSLYLWQNTLAKLDRDLPGHLKNDEWKSRFAYSALAAWIDMQLPMDKLVLRSQSTVGGTLSSGDSSGSYAFIEPNIEFFDRIIAQNKMIIAMLEGLNIGSRANLSVSYLKDAEHQLLKLRELALKQSQGEDLDAQDNQLVRDFAKMYSVGQSGEKKLSWQNNALNTKVRQTMSVPRLLMVAHPFGDKIVFAVGPIYNHLETK